MKIMKEPRPLGKSCSAGSKHINMEPLGVMQVVNLSTCPLLSSRFQVVEISRCQEFVKICINIVEGVCSPLSSCSKVGKG